MLLLETPRRFSRISTLRVSAAWFAFPDRIYTHARRYMHVREESCSHASSMECDTFSCVIKSRVTRALYIIHAATPSTAAFAIAHPPFLFFHVCFPSSRVIFFFLFRAHSLSGLNISRAKRANRKHPLCMPRTNMCGNFIGPTRSACAIFTAAIVQQLSRLFPVKCHEAKFSGRCGLGCERPEF